MSTDEDIARMVGPLIERLTVLQREVTALELRSDIWGERRWREELAPDHPKMVEMSRIRRELDVLSARRPVHPIHAEVRAEFLAAVRGKPSDRIAALLAQE